MQHVAAAAEVGREKREHFPLVMRQPQCCCGCCGMLWTVLWTGKDGWKVLGGMVTTAVAIDVIPGGVKSRSFGQ